MFFRKPDEGAQAREQADNLLRMAAKVEAYRMDVMPVRQLEELQGAAERLRELRHNPEARVPALDAASEELHEVMVRCGGEIYPVTFGSENVEMLVVAAIVAIGIREFFLTPFKIPTNSMYPTYYGMTPYVYRADDPGPDPLKRTENFLTKGAIHYDVVAPADGQVSLLVSPTNKADFLQVMSEPEMGRKWFGLMAEEQNEYKLSVGGQEVAVTVPKDFRLDEVMMEALFPDLQGAWLEQGVPVKYMQDHGYLHQDDQGQYFVTSPRKFRQGERVLNFDRRTGDMLFVDRFTYNFFPPKVGDPFVFRTTGIPGLERVGQGGQYFIKRLVGRTGDQLEVKPPALWSNGGPIQGAKSFALEARQADNYPGYTYATPSTPPPYMAQAGETFVVPAASYFAMGDNSPLSYDSRYWGPVPRQNVVGRALVIVYPFTSRWGLAR